MSTGSAEKLTTRDKPDKHKDRDRDAHKKKHRSHKSGSTTKVHRRHRSASRDRGDDKSVRYVGDDKDARPPSGDKAAKSVPALVPELEPRRSTDDRPKSSYPSFSKAHSREAVHSREHLSDVPKRPASMDSIRFRDERRSSTRSVPAQPTPSPPLTANAPNPSGSRSNLTASSGGAPSDVQNGKSTESTPRANGMARDSRSSLLRGKGMQSDLSSMPGKDMRSDLSSMPGKGMQSDISSMPGTFPEEERRSTPNSGFRRTTTSTTSQPLSDFTQTTHSDQTNTDSDATSVAPGTTRPQRPHVKTTQDVSPPSATDSQPKTPGPEDHSFPIPSNPKTHVIDVSAANALRPSGREAMTPMTAKQIPMPPPPPPPPPPVAAPPAAPRVDYLLKNGGLGTAVPRRLVPQHPVQQHAMYQSPGLAAIAPAEEHAKIFQPLHKRLDEYLHVLRGNGSLAVATGYKSVARRLLDKLSQIFARDISSQKCHCVVCNISPQPTLSDEEDSGVSWGEILEFVSGRRELPQWPPFSIQADDGGLGILGATSAPMQKLDIDVPDEYRDHYIRQNQKTKKAVQNWLAHQPEYPSGPPDEADEDTLMFAMMTKLEVHQRNLFIALMHNQSTISPSRAPTPAERPQVASDALRRAKNALRRLYRLDRAPRDCEAAMYLLHNPPLHGMLATLAEVNEGEWDILVSGRFDGFLWSGAETSFPSHYPSPAPSRTPYSRTTTPYSRTTTPFSGISNMRAATPLGDPRATPSLFASRNPTTTPAPGLPPPPVQLDEDTEIAVLAEVERNLFTDMERFEDAFETLHARAELVRQLLRERGAGLALQSQRRRGAPASDLDPRIGTPASAVTDFEHDPAAIGIRGLHPAAGFDDTDDDDDLLADLASLAPDDSASQIGTSRRRGQRRDRRSATTTPAPAPVAEEHESVFDDFAPSRGPTPADLRKGRRARG